MVSKADIYLYFMHVATAQPDLLFIPKKSKNIVDAHLSLYLAGIV